MQLLPPLSTDPKAIAREKAAGHHLPYARHVDDVTIETRDGLLMQFIHLRADSDGSGTACAAAGPHKATMPTARPAIEQYQ